MKKIILACAVAALALTGCDKKTEVVKVADYLYEYEADEYGTEAPFISDKVLADFSCSSVRNGNFYGRNVGTAEEGAIYQDISGIDGTVLVL